MGRKVEGRWLTVDPGEETGWSIWKGQKLLAGGQTMLWSFANDVWEALSFDEGTLGSGNEAYLLPDVSPEGNDGGPFELVVIEKFAVYPWEARKGTLDFDEVRTAQLIGALTWMCSFHDVEVVKQGANIKDAALKGGAKEYFARPLKENRHQNDAIMHGVYFMQTEMLDRPPMLSSRAQ